MTLTLTCFIRKWGPGRGLVVIDVPSVIPGMLGVGVRPGGDFLVVVVPLVDLLLRTRERGPVYVDVVNVRSLVL